MTLDLLLRHSAISSRYHRYPLNHMMNPDFRAIFWSSMAMPADLYSYIKNDIGIPYVQGQYGSTEICPVAATCSAHPFDFHLGYGPTLVVVRSLHAKRLVAEGEEGYLLVTKCGAIQASGCPAVPTGTMLINFRTGDYASLVQTADTLCACGRRTPVLKSLRRHEHVQMKARYGCQGD